MRNAETKVNTLMYFKTCHKFAVDGKRFDPYRIATNYHVSKSYFGIAIQKGFFIRVGLGYYNTPLLCFDEYQVEMVIKANNEMQSKKMREKRGTRKDIKVESILKGITDRQIFDELRIRGYIGELSKKYVI